MSLTFCAYFVIDRLWILPSRPRRVMRRTSVAARLHKPWQLLWMFARRLSGAHVMSRDGSRAVGECRTGVWQRTIV